MLYPVKTAYDMALSVSVQPDLHLLSLFDQFIAERGVSDADKRFGPFPCGFALELDYAVFSGYVLYNRARNSHNRTGLKGGHDPGAYVATLVSEGGVDAYNPLAPSRIKCTEDEVKLAACARYLC